MRVAHRIETALPNGTRVQREPRLGSRRTLVKANNPRGNRNPSGYSGVLLGFRSPPAFVAAEQSRGVRDCTTVWLLATTFIVAGEGLHQE